MMESVSIDTSYTGRVVLCVGLIQAQNDHIPQTNTELVYYYHIDAPQDIINSNTVDTDILCYT